MKLLLFVVLLVGIGSIQCDESETSYYKNDFEIFRAHDGVQLGPILFDIPENSSDSAYFDFDQHPDYQADIVRDATRKKRDHSNEDFNYSKAYEQFLADNFGFSNSGSEEYKGKGDGQRSSDPASSKSCKTVYKDGKECTICKNPKTNAQAETCTYSSAPKQKKYAFKRKRQYSRRDSDQHSPESADSKEQDSSSASKEVNTHDNKPLVEQGSSSSHPRTDFPREPKYIDKIVDDFKKKDWSLCDRQYKRGATCYYCKTRNGIKKDDCIYDSGDFAGGNRQPQVKPKDARSTTPHTDSPPHALPFNSREKRVFKRTISMHVDRSD